MKMMFMIFVLLGLGLSSAKAQYEMDAGIQLGGANYLGDIGGFGGQGQDFILDFRPEYTSLAFSGFFRYGFNRKLSAKLTIGYARIQGADSLSGNPSRIGRNLSFRTDLYEATTIGEYTFFQKKRIIKRVQNQIDFKARAFFGIGILLYYPYAQFNDQWYELRPLETEGVSYSEATAIIPLGVSFDFTFNEQFRLGAEIGYRFSFTDYLDDISTTFADPDELPFAESAIFANRSAQAFAREDADLPDPENYTPGKIRGNPENKDGYFIAQLSLTYVIKAGRDYHSRRKRGFFR